jgi:NAD(P)-dependent dehydrogenase (short-subunit alcohol dehydrogenase family)
MGIPIESSHLKKQMVTMLDFAGQIAVVTGASKGIGYFIAKELALAGAHVIAVARSEIGLRRLQDEHDGKLKDRFTLGVVDVADMEAIDALGKFVEDGEGRTDILVANAGQFGPAGPIAELDPKQFEHTISLNFISTWRLIRAFDGLLRKSQRARALVVTSGAAHAAQAFWGAYPASKAACEALVHMWANETKDLPLRVNLFDPGPTRTSIRDSIPETAGKPSNLAEPEDVARKALHAVAPNLDRTGQIYQAKFDRWVSRQRPG